MLNQDYEYGNIETPIPNSTSFLGLGDLIVLEGGVCMCVTYIYVCMCVCMYAYMHACVCMYVCVYAYDN